MKKQYCRRINNYIEKIGIQNTIKLIKDFYDNDDFELMFNTPEAEIIASYLSYAERSFFDVDAKIMSFLNYYHYKSKQIY